MNDIQHHPRHAFVPRPLLGKVAVVTGGSRGIGRSVAKLFAQAGAAAVLVSARSANEVADCVAELDTIGKGIGVTGDVGDPVFWADVEKALAPYGRWDILVNCAGASGPVGPLATMSASDWDAVMRTNLTGTLLGCQAAIPYMAGRRSGVIINVSSGLAQRRVQPGLAAYSATKAALVRLSAVLAGELQTDGIEVYALHPGIVETRMSQQHKTEAIGGGAAALEQVLQATQMLTPDESARAFLLLASGAAEQASGSFVQFDAPDVVALGKACVAAVQGAQVV